MILSNSYFVKAIFEKKTEKKIGKPIAFYEIDISLLPSGYYFSN